MTKRGEVVSWAKAPERNLLTEEQYKHIFQRLQRLPLLTNSLIKLTNNNLKT
ncbi:hypothetical protein [Rufibacter sp. XAAS-G3-1]|uniref:hypothetical protein n=1 Tax=Rufibacter sp. XAAS-G3-1 TaxID=2729134 RepID=UPI0015E7AC92|nr:hypothetical protein [Rufibacter sp. XAAS-G3-1]